MTLQFRPAAACVVALMLATACSQSDGPLPAPTGDTPNRLHDLARDLQEVAGNDKDGPKDFQDDLLVFLDNTEPHTQAQELSRRVSTAIAGKRLPDDQAAKLANQLWITVAARQLSGPQIRSLQSDVQMTVQGLGVPEGSAKQIAEQVGDVQQALTHRHRRWYERS